MGQFFLSTFCDGAIYGGRGGGVVCSSATEHFFALMSGSLLEVNQRGYKRVGDASFLHK